MIIKRKRKVESLPLNMETVNRLYPIVNENGFNPDRECLAKVVRCLSEVTRCSTDRFRCYIEKQALDAFLVFANEAYDRFRNEAVGIIMGYYLHDEENPDKKIVVATNFIQANGPATSVTCTISYDDYIRFDNFCNAHNMNQIVWIHSHPGFGCFFSGVDSAMLASNFCSSHQVGVVVDILQNEVMGFKIIEGEERQQSVFWFDIQESINQNHLVAKTLYLNSKVSFQPQEAMAENLDYDKNVSVTESDNIDSETAINDENIQLNE